MKYIKRTIDKCLKCNSTCIEQVAENNSIYFSCKKCGFSSIIKYIKKRKRQWK